MSRHLFISLCSLCLLCMVSYTASAEEASVKGVFKGEGKEAKLAHVTIVNGKDDRKGRIIMAFSEKVKKDKDPELAAMFGDLGSALVITIKPNGQITGCFVAHSAHDKGGFNSIGEIELKDYKNQGGKISGHLTTNGKQEAFGKTWEVDFKFEGKAP